MARPWTPALARTKAERLAVYVNQGTDPNAAEHERRRLAVDLAFESYAERFRISCGDDGWGRMVERTLRLHITPQFKRKPINAITRANIAALLDTLPPAKIALKRNTFAVIRRLFRWAINRGDLVLSPCDGMETPCAVPPLDRVLTDAELTRIWKRSLKAGKLFGSIVRMLVSTGQRREEVTALDWSEIDQEQSIWTLPRERAKNGVAHIIPLNELAIGVLHEASGEQAVWPSRELVFATTGGKKFVAHSKGKQQLDAAILHDGQPGMPSWRLHDLRRTVATGFQRLGIRFEVTEAVPNHVSGSKAGIAGTYQRHDWSEEKRQGLDMWGRHVTLLLCDTPMSGPRASPVPLEIAFAAGVELGLKIGKMSLQTG